MTALALIAIAFSIDIITYMCNCCKLPSQEAAEAEEALGSDSRVWDPFKFREHKECSICLVEY